MHRKPCKRYDDPGHAHALTFTCYRGLPLLSRDRTRSWLIEALETARRRARNDLWGYVVMPNHVHILVASRPDSLGISRLLWTIKRPVARKAFAFLSWKRTPPAGSRN